MSNQENKYIVLAGSIFLTMIGFLLSLVLLLLGLKWLLGLLNYIPWLTYLYMLGILLLPASLFISVYYIYARRTRRHRSAVVRYVSWLLFAVATLAWIVCIVLDLKTFIAKAHTDISYYHSFDMIFLAGNVGLIFFTGVYQALTAEKEVDWIDRDRQGDTDV